LTDASKVVESRKTTMGYRREYSLAPRLVLAVIVALAAGYVWACVENHRNPLDLLKLFSSPEPAPEPKPAPQPPKKEVEKPAPPPVVKKDPKVEPAPIAKADPHTAPAPALYSSIEMSALFGTVEDMIRRGRFYAAIEELGKKSRLKVPENQIQTFSDYEQRATRYYQLLQETTKGITVEMPPITRIFIKNAGKIVGKVLVEDKNYVILETLTNLRPKIMKDTIEKQDTLLPAFGYAEICLELKTQATYAGLAVEGAPGKPYSYRELPGKSVTALKYFDLADFCARNGANDQVLPLFDEAMKRDPNLLATVHEVKGERMTNVFLYFLQIKSVPDAQKTLEILKKNYGDTKAYRENVATDEEIQKHMAYVMERRPAPSQPIAKLDPKPSPPAPAPASPPSPGDPKPVTPPPPPTPEPAAAPERSSDPPPNVSPTSIRLPDGTPSKVADAVAKGDRYYDEAMKHLNLSNPQVSPTNWGDENHQAMVLFKKALDEGYNPAQDMYGKADPIPQGLLDRVREAQMCNYMCRRRSVRTAH
jgi:hypothetical protein